MAKAKTPGTPATVALRKAGIEFVAREYKHDPAAASYGLEAATALGVEPARVFKTLLVDTGAGLAVAVVPVDRQLDLKAVAAALGAKKVAMAQPADAERVTGYVVGGISPVGQKRAADRARRVRVGPSDDPGLRRPARARPRACTGRPDPPHPGHTRPDQPLTGVVLTARRVTAASRKVRSTVAVVAQSMQASVTDWP